MLKPRQNTAGARLSASEQIKFLDFLQQALTNGFSLNQSLTILPGIWPEKSTLLLAMSKQLAAGETLAQILQKVGFSSTIAAQINLAFAEGRLTICLAQLVTLLKLKEKQLRKIRAELAYPAVLAGLMFFLLVFMQTILQQEFSEQSLPGTVVVAVVACLCCCLGLAIVHGHHLFKKQNYAALKKLGGYPFIGPAVKLYVQYLLTFDLTLFLGNGFSLQQICQLSLTQSADSLQYFLGQKIAAQVQGGATVQQIIAREEVLPNRLRLLLATGSSRSELAKRCQLLSQSLFNELVAKINGLVVSIQPLCFIAIGIAIIGMYLKLLMPMYAMMQTF